MHACRAGGVVGVEAGVRLVVDVAVGALGVEVVERAQQEVALLLQRVAVGPGRSTRPSLRLARPSRARATNASSASVATRRGWRPQRRSASDEPPAPTRSTTTGNAQTITPIPSLDGFRRMDSPNRSTYTWRISSSDSPRRMRAAMSRRCWRADAVELSATESPSQSTHRSSLARLRVRVRDRRRPAAAATARPPATTTATSRAAGRPRRPACTRRRRHAASARRRMPPSCRGRATRPGRSPTR